MRTLLPLAPFLLSPLYLPICSRTEIAPTPLGWHGPTDPTRQIAEFFFLGDLGQLLLIAVYLTLNLLLILLGAAGDIDWQAHHAARLTYANLPLVIGLAGKNNVLSKVTGFAYESLNVLHRWSARFVLVSSAIHIGGRIYVSRESLRLPASGRPVCSVRPRSSQK